MPQVRHTALRPYTHPTPQQKELEARHSGRAVLLVSHGDTLSITQAAAGGGDLRAHRQHGLGTAELRRLPGQSGGAGAGAEAKAAAEAAVCV
jgi:broad specificity phosphatase PhoE